VENECQENPWLEKAENDFDADDDLVFQHSDGEGENDYKREDDYSTEDDIPDYLIRATEGRNRPENIEWGETQTFYDKLKEQAGNMTWTNVSARLWITSLARWRTAD
jgi:DNA-directed RNA polymerase specialized sigma54-like protein